jgi:hypothetical protein
VPARRRVPRALGASVPPQRDRPSRKLGHPRQGPFRVLLLPSLSTVIPSTRPFSAMRWISPTYAHSGTGRCSYFDSLAILFCPRYYALARLGMKARVNKESSVPKHSLWRSRLRLMVLSGDKVRGWDVSDQCRPSDSVRFLCVWPTSGSQETDGAM